MRRSPQDNVEGRTVALGRNGEQKTNSVDAQEEITTFLLSIDRGRQVSSRRDHFALTPSLKSVAKKELANVVVLFDLRAGCKISMACFNFSDSFELFVGTVLPFGIGEHRPAAIAVAANRDDCWEVIACYSDMSYPTLLWVEESKPKWLGAEKWKYDADEDVPQNKSVNRMTNLNRSRRRKQKMKKTMNNESSTSTKQK